MSGLEVLVMVGDELQYDGNAGISLGILGSFGSSFLHGLHFLDCR